MSAAPSRFRLGPANRSSESTGPSEEGSPYPKCSLLLRGLARGFDLAVAWGMFIIGERVGALAALLFLLFADGMLQGQSFGKRMFGVKVVFVPTRTPGRYRDSVLRNAPLGLIVVLGMMPELGRYAFYAGVVVIGGIEAWKVWRDPLGLRLGDVWAQTQVVDGKVVAGAPRAALAAGTPMRATGKLMSSARLRRVRGRRREKCGSR